jgi:creatinine amidohydrolase/Fe(II)-dependent formamide hydrolase-like protein
MVRVARLSDSASAQAANGVYGGSPAHASAALGDVGVRLIVDGTVAALRAFLNGG